jgi:hypothetical protein
VRASDKDRDVKLIAITSEPAWVIEGFYYRWLKPSFERADVIFVLCPNVYLRDWRILKRFVSRKLGIISSKRESLLDLNQLVQWNHKYDADNLQRAMDFINEFKDKVEWGSLGRQTILPKTIPGNFCDERSVAAAE